MNKTLLLKVKEQILAEPRQFNMKEWFYGQLPNGETPANCGTAACIAGWAYTLAIGCNPDQARQIMRELSGFFRPDLALGITAEQADRLFHEMNWPKQFQSTPRAGLKLRAKRAAARIDYFIRTGGK